MLVVVGCTQPPAEKAHDVCQAYCACVDPGAIPSVVDRCVVEQCLPDLPPVSDECLDCVFAHDQVCPELLDQCSDLCLPTMQTPKLGGM